MFLTEHKCKNFANLIVTQMSQYIGAFAGIFMTYILVKYYNNYDLYPTLNKKNAYGDLLYLDRDGTPYWGRLIG